MKKLFLLFAALCCIMVAKAANEVTRVTIDGIIYILYDDNTAEILKVEDATGDITLPSIISYEGKNYMTTLICDLFAHDNPSITSVTIPNSVTTIGGSAFRGCASLQSVTIGAFVQSICKCAFDNCRSLNQIIAYPTTPPTCGDEALPNKGLFYIYCADKEGYQNLLEKLYGGQERTLSTARYLNHSIYPGYFNSIIEAITLAANRVALSDEDEAAIKDCKDKMTAIYETELSSTEQIKINPVMHENELAAHKVIALAGIRQAVPGDGLMEGEQTVVNEKIAMINSATSLGEIYALQKEVFEYIALCPLRQAALAAIEEAMQGNANSKYLHDLVKKREAAIINATKAQTITDNRVAAVNILKEVIDAYISAKEEGKEEGKSSALGTMGTPQDGPAVKVTDKDDNEIILYSPKKVEYIKFGN